MKVGPGVGTGRSDSVTGASLKIVGLGTRPMGGSLMGAA